MKNTNTKTLFKNVLAQGSYVNLNCRVVQKLGIKEGIVLYELFGQQHYFINKGKMKNGFFYVTQDYLKTSTYLSDHQIRAAVKTLEETWVDMNNYSVNLETIVDDIKKEEVELKAEVKKIVDDKEISDDKKKSKIAELLKEWIDVKLEGDIIKVIADDKNYLDDDKKKLKIKQLKKDAGYMQLIETKFTFSYGDKTKWYKVNTKVVDEFIKSGDGSVSMNTIRPDAFVIYNKALAHKTNPTVAVVFSDLLTSYYVTEMYGNLEEDEWFKNVYDVQANRLGISRQSLVEAKNGYIIQLVNAGLINKKTMGAKNATYISINWDRLFEIIAGCTVEEFNGGILVKENNSEVERITRKLLDRVKEVSGLDWKFNHTKCAFIEQRLEDGFIEDDMYNIIEYKYKDYKRIANGKYMHRFNWTNLFGSQCETWITNMHNDEKTNQEKLKLEALSLRIIEAVKDISGLDWRLDESYYPLLAKQLECGVSEDELVELVAFVYNWKLKNEGKIKKFTWNKVYGEFQDDSGKGYSCFATVLSMRKAKNKANEIAKSLYKNKSKDNPEKRQCMNSNTNGDMRGKISQDEITEGYF